MTTPVPSPPPPAHTRVTWSGVIGTATAPIEQWSFSLNLRPDPLLDGFSDAQIDGIANGARTCWQTALAPQFDPSIVLTESRVAVVLATGKVKKRADFTFLQGINLVPVVGSKALAVVMPPQIALVVSLTTARPGKTGRGRFFLPFPAYGLNPADRRLDASAATSVMDAAAAFINAANLLTAGPVVVASSKGYLSDVIGLRVGRAADTLRSRRRDVLEGYSSRSLAPS